MLCLLSAPAILANALKYMSPEKKYDLRFWSTIQQVRTPQVTPNNSARIIAPTQTPIAGASNIKHFWEVFTQSIQCRLNKGKELSRFTVAAVFVVERDLEFSP